MDPSGGYGGRIQKTVLPDPNGLTIDRMTGDWLYSPAGRVFRFLLKCLLIVGVVWGGLHLLKNNPSLLILLVFITLLLYGVIRAGLEMGEKSPFMWPGQHWVTWWPWWWL
jgi:hypothetical protein